MSPIGHFDLIAPLYDRLFGPPDPEPLRELLALPKSGWLLDVGGGTGRVAQTLHDQGVKVIVLDKSAGMVRRATQKGLTAVRGEVERLPFPDGTFGRMLVIDAFHHFRDHNRAAQELIRVLSPEGRLVIQEPNPTRWAVRVMAWAEKVALMRSRFRGREAMMKLFERGEGKVTLAKEEGFYLWLIVEKGE